MERWEGEFEGPSCLLFRFEILLVDVLRAERTVSTFQFQFYVASSAEAGLSLLDWLFSIAFKSVAGHASWD